MFSRIRQLISLLRKPKCSCFQVRTSLGGHEYVEARDKSYPIHGDAAMMNRGLCPDCKGTSFLFGANGGIGTIVMCEGCGSQFLCEVLDNQDPAKIIYWGRTYCGDLQR